MHAFRKGSGNRPRYPRRPLRQRAVLAMPNGMTFANLFFGIFAIITAARGDFVTAGWFVVASGIADVLDGRIARAVDSNSRIGAELDSLVDVISFGLAPAMIMYFAVLRHDGWDWLFVFIFVGAAAWRLAVFNVEQAGHAKRYFHGLPSPAAGLTLATYYWFSQTPLYMDTNIANLPWHQMLRFVMLGLAALMISAIPYPAFPTVGFRSRREIFALVCIIGAIAAMYWIPREFLFPACVIYIVYGFGKTVLFGLFNRKTPNDPSALDDLAAGPMSEPVVAVASAPRLNVSAHSPMPAAPSSTTQSGNPRRKRRRRPPRGNRPDRPSDNSPDTPSSGE